MKLTELCRLHAVSMREIKILLIRSGMVDVLLQTAAVRRGEEGGPRLESEMRGEEEPKVYTGNERSDVKAWVKIEEGRNSPH